MHLPTYDLLGAALISDFALTKLF